MTYRTSIAALSLIAFLAISRSLCAQQAKPPTLEEVLDRVGANLNHFDTRVPSLFCDEHVISSQAEQGERDQSTVVDSVFRLNRSSAPDRSDELIESRDIKYVNGMPATSQKLDGPTLLSGAFEGGLAIVSIDQRACMKYQLQRPNRGQPTAPYVVRFATLLTPENTGNCLLQEKSKGRVLVDPASMQITHLEISTPRHTIIEQTAYTSAIIGKRDVIVDYASVTLGGELFWMPSMIRMRATAGAGTFHMSVWSFQATYRNYHKLQVTSRIVSKTPE